MDESTQAHSDRLDLAISLINAAKDETGRVIHLSKLADDIAGAIDSASQDAYLRGVSADERVREKVMAKLPADHPYRGVITRQQIAAITAAEQRGRVAGLIAARDAVCPRCNQGAPLEGYRHSDSICPAAGIHDLIAAQEARHD